MISPRRAKHLLEKSEAIIEGHFVGTNGKHFSVYIAKDRATRFTTVISELCEGIAEMFAYNDIDVVVAPAVGAIAMSQWTAHHLTRMRPNRPEVLALYAEHEDEMVYEQGKGSVFPTRFETDLLMRQGDQLILRKPSFVLKRGFNLDVRGKRVLGIEDVLTTGGSAARTAQAILASEGFLVGFGVLANGGNVTPADIGVSQFESLMVVERQIFTEEECTDHGLCAQGVPINTNFGHGAAFLGRKRATS